MKKIIPGFLFVMSIAGLHAQTAVINPVKTPVEKTITLPSRVKLQYVEQGDASGIPVIFLHGFTDSWHSFETVLPHLPPHIHAFALTQRGHGNSDKPAAGYTPADFAGDVAAFIKQLKLGPVIIAGHSFGAVVAQRFAIDHFSLVKGLVITSSAAAFAENPGMKEFLDAVLQLQDPVDFAFADEFQKSTITKPVDPVFYDTLVKETMKVPARVWKATLQGLMNVNFVKDLAKIKVPSLVLWGDKDMFCLRKDQDLLIKNIPSAKLVVFEGTGHALHWEEPARFAADLAAYVNSLK